MIKTVLDLINLFFSISPFLFSLIVWTILAITFAKSIKKHYKAYYWVAGVMGVVYALPMLLRVLGLDTGFNIGSYPILGAIFSEYSSAAYFVHPVIVIIMFMGAFSPKHWAVGRLMSIRKELSIIVGFSVIAHATKRILFTFPRAWDYFASYEESIANPRVVSELGSGITNFVLVLGIVMSVLFLVLWVTSFDKIRIKMGAKNWKSTQRWSYALYAMLFIHAVGLKAGDLVSSHAREQKAKIEIVEKAKTAISNTVDAVKDSKAGQAVTKASESARPKRFNLANVEPSRNFKYWANIIIYIAVYGSYLVLRLRKAKRDRERIAANKLKVQAAL